MVASRETLQEMSASIDTLMDRGRREDAGRLLAEALEKSTHDRAYHLFFQAEMAGHLERDRRRRNTLLTDAVRHLPDDPFLLRNLGICHLLDENITKARRLFQEALRMEPRDGETLRCLGLACSMGGRETRAMEWYGQALAVNPGDHDAMRQMGVSLSKLGKDREALGWYRRALECCAQDYDAMRQMGISFAMLGDYTTAVTWLNLALGIHPGDHESRHNLKLVQRKQSGRDAAFGGALLGRAARAINLAWRRLMDRLG